MLKTFKILVGRWVWKQNIHIHLLWRGLVRKITNDLCKFGILGGLVKPMNTQIENSTRKIVKYRYCLRGKRWGGQIRPPSSSQPRPKIHSKPKNQRHPIPKKPEPPFLSQNNINSEEMTPPTPTERTGEEWHPVRNIPSRTKPRKKANTPVPKRKRMTESHNTRI